MEKKLFTAEIQRMKAKGSPALSNAADLTPVLDAISTLAGDIQSLDAFLRQNAVPPSMPQAAPPIAESGDPVTEIARLRAEICLMSERIEDTKREISAIRPKDTDNDRLAIVTNELDAIVDATERATQGILESAETVDDLARKLHARADDPETVQDIEAIQNAVVRIFEESNFQDITGQRISKVVKTLQFIEDRLNRMIDIWGHDSLAEAPVAPVEDIAVDEDSKLLNGPALGDQGISQADIDKLFD